MLQNPESSPKLNIKKAMRAAAATAFISAGIAAPMAHADSNTYETIGPNFHTDEDMSVLPYKRILPNIAFDTMPPETKSPLKEFSFLEQGLEIADVEQYSKLQVSNFSKEDIEVFNLSYKDIKGKDAQAPEIKDGEMAFIVAVDSIQGPTLKLKGLEKKDTDAEKFIINIEFSSPSDTRDYTSVDRKNYIIGIVDKQADIELYYPKAEEPFLILPSNFNK